MLDIDHGPMIFMIWIAVVFIAPALYGVFLVDAFWKKHQQEGGKDDVFN